MPTPPHAFHLIVTTADPKLTDRGAKLEPVSGEILPDSVKTYPIRTIPAPFAVDAMLLDREKLSQRPANGVAEDIVGDHTEAAVLRVANPHAGFVARRGEDFPYFNPIALSGDPHCFASSSKSDGSPFTNLMNWSNA